VLDNLFFTDQAWSHVSGYVNSQNTRTRRAENPHALHENPLHLFKIGVSRTLFEETITAENSPVPLVCWKRTSGIAGFSKMGTPPIP
jgi:hypothetical protein